MFPLFLLLLLFRLSDSAGYKEDPCEEDPDPGPCQYYQIKWFWDAIDEECKEFHYGGCMGTRNRFNTKQACVKQCRYKLHNPVNIPDLCLLEPDQGNCGDERRGQWWFYFNSDSGTCEKFFFHGCGGNDNKFYSLHLCRKVCAERLSPQIACDQCDLRTSICKSHSKFNYTCECRIGYEKDVHGECIDIDECRGGTNNCDRNAWCTNTIGSYSCECMASYRGDGHTCTYVGLGKSTLDCYECSSDATCTSGVCQCKQGFQGDGFNCTDVNECMRTPYVCDKNAECVNREGSFVCQCLPGFAGNGFNCTQSKTSCLDKFDRGYQNTCGGENWREHFYFDHESRTCALFWYDGCPGRSSNIYSDLSTCASMCEETNVLTRAEICWDKFDMAYKNQCATGHWVERYYFDHASLTCRQFWYDGCRSSSRNLFDDALTCQWLCEAQPMYKTKSCLEDFDHRYKGMCNGGRWRQQFYFDRHTKKCIPFWYDGCRGSSQNLFPDEITCLKNCEDPAKRDRYKSRKPYPSVVRRTTPYGVTHGFTATQHPRTISAIKPWHSNDKALYREKLGEVFRPNTSNVCETANPCQNNATCIFAWKKNTYYCKCRPGWTGSHCTEVIEFDPCAAMPCKNGATCKAKTEKGKTSHECYCASGYGGVHCDERPCDSSPCLNNGTCRTTAAASTFFCDCPPDMGGKNCEFKIGVPPKDDFGSQVEQISSGKAEWVEEMKRRLGTIPKPTTVVSQQADEEFKDPEAKKKERAEQQEATEGEMLKMKEEQAKREAEVAGMKREEEKKRKMTAEEHKTSLAAPLTSFFTFVLLLLF